MRSVTILAGCGKDGRPEPFDTISLERGGLYTIVGNTGSGKSRFIKDIEHLACGDSIHRPPGPVGRSAGPTGRAAEAHPPIWWPNLGQNMRFVLDVSVEEFLQLHARCRDRRAAPAEVLALANEITPEPVALRQGLNQLSGGQSRALMIADIALIWWTALSSSLTRLKTRASTRSGRWACFRRATSWCWLSPTIPTQP